MTTSPKPTKDGALTDEQLARKFHEIYERLAPSFGYETRKETRQFDPNTPNGKLMVAVCGELLNGLTAEAAEQREKPTSSVDYWQQKGHFGSPEKWQEVCRLYRIRCSNQDVAEISKLHAYIEGGLLVAVRPAMLSAAPQPAAQTQEVPQPELRGPQ